MCAGSHGGKREGRQAWRDCVGAARLRASLHPHSGGRHVAISRSKIRPNSLPLLRGAFPSRRMGRYVGTLCVVLSLLAFIVASGPHLVHHLADIHPHDDPPIPQSPDCLVLALLQQTPVAEGTLALVPVPLPLQERTVFAYSVRLPEGLGQVFQARAPPTTLLRSMPSA
jgi:hypothetical protein